MFCLQSAGRQADIQQMLCSCPRSSLRDDHVMESNRATFCLKPQTGLMAGPRSVHKAVLARSKEHEKRSLAGWQRESLRTREALPQRLTYIGGSTGQGAAGPVLAIKTHSRLAIIWKGRNSSSRGRACVHDAGGLWMCYSALCTASCGEFQWKQFAVSLTRKAP
jgi:hypothetical protein